MTMAMLNILSQSSSTLSSPTVSSSSLVLSSYKYPHHFSHHHVHISNSFSFPTTTVNTNLYKLNSSSSSSTSCSCSANPNSYSMSTHNSGSSLTSRCSWMQDNSNSASYTPVSSNGCRPIGPSPLHSVLPTSPAKVASVQDLFDFICSGPLIEKMKLDPEKIGSSIDRWLECGRYICRMFQLNEFNLTHPQKVRVYHYYIPVFIWCEDQIIEHRASYKEGDEIPPLVIGFSAPQGCGKTTLVLALNFLFGASGRKSATISIDDFYLTAEDQAKLREQNPENLLLELRGNAGSHDLPLSVETLTALTQMTKEGMKMKLPRYDKSAYGGKGDRDDPSNWPEVEGPLQVVLFEGWMLGFKPLPVEVVKAVDPQLEVVNKRLEAYYEAWDKFIKSWIVIKIKEPSCVYQWRLQAEHAMLEDGKAGMSDEEVMDFVSRYLPAYRAYLPTLYSEGPSGSNPEHVLMVDIDEERNPILAG
ncbi:hypothetical protein MKW92_029652 [Papaver armeniacum]|nr:hypothetical protein MKW92_029652 [Papaver armeniacum]